MGYYLQTKANHNKAAQLVQMYPGTVQLLKPSAWKDIPEGKVLVVIADNGLFEAAGVCYNEREYDEFTAPDPRPMSYVLMDKETAFEKSGYANKRTNRE